MKKKNLSLYLQFISATLKERALKAKVEADAPNEKCADYYNNGYLMAFHEVIDFMKQQAPFFELDQKEVGLDDIDPDVDLLSLRRRTDVDLDQNLEP